MYPDWYGDQPAYDGNSVSIEQKHHVLSILLNSLNTPTDGGGGALSRELKGGGKPDNEE